MQCCVGRRECDAQFSSTHKTKHMAPWGNTSYQPSMLAVKQAANISLVDAALLAAALTLCLRLHAHLVVEADTLLLTDGPNVVDTAGAGVTGQLGQLQCDVVAHLADLIRDHQGRARWELQQQTADGTARLSTCTGASTGTFTPCELQPLEASILGPLAPEQQQGPSAAMPEPVPMRAQCCRFQSSVLLTLTITANDSTHGLEWNLSSSTISSST